MQMYAMIQKDRSKSFLGSQTQIANNCLEIKEWQSRLGEKTKNQKPKAKAKNQEKNQNKNKKKHKQKQKTKSLNRCRNVVIWFFVLDAD